MHHAQLSEYVNLCSSAATSTLSGLASSGLSHDQALATVDRLANQQAYMLAANDIFFASAVIFLLLIPLVFLTRRVRASGAGGDAAAGAH